MARGIATLKTIVNGEGSGGGRGDVGWAGYSRARDLQRGRRRGAAPVIRRCSDKREVRGSKAPGLFVSPGSIADRGLP